MVPFFRRSQRCEANGIGRQENGMFTLKIADTGTHEHTMTWLPGITAIHRLGRVAGSEYKTTWSSYLQEPDLRNYATSAADGDDVALLTVETQHEWFHVICHRAWLLGPTGDTIERIAP